MKKLFAILLSVAMILGMAACGAGKQQSQDAQKPSLPQNPEELSTIADVYNAGYAIDSTSTLGNLFSEIVRSDSGLRYLVITKLTEEQIETLSTIDYFADDAYEQYLEVIGENEFLEMTDMGALGPSEKTLESYPGMTIADFENLGFEISGYSGGDGSYVLFFNDDLGEYTVYLEDGTKVKDCDDTESLDAEIQDCKISKVEFDDFSIVFMDTYLDKYKETPESVEPEEIGEPRASLEEINKEIGCNIKHVGVSGVINEKFSVIDGNIAQYIFSLNGISYRVRAAKDLDIDLNNLSETDSLIDEDGYQIISYNQTDIYNSVRFAYDGVQYSFAAFDNGQFEYEMFSDLEEEYRDLVYVDTVNFKMLSYCGSFDDVSELNASLFARPIAPDTVQISCYGPYDEEKGLTAWTIQAKFTDDKLVYDKSLKMNFTNEGQSNSEGGSGYFEISDGYLNWASCTDDSFAKCHFVPQEDSVMPQ